MKGSCTLVASVLAASTVALTSSSSSSSSSAAVDGDLTFNPCSNEAVSSSCSRKGEDSSSRMSSSGKEKFAPRFDGLRFIETLVTAHR